MENMYNFPIDEIFRISDLCHKNIFDHKNVKISQLTLKAAIKDFPTKKFYIFSLKNLFSLN